MNSPDLVRQAALKAGVTQGVAQSVITAAVAAMTKALVAGEEVLLLNFGKFITKDMPERDGRNPATGEAITIPASRRAIFKAQKSLKDALNK